MSYKLTLMNLGINELYRSLTTSANAACCPSGESSWLSMSVLFGKVSGFGGNIV